MSRADVGTALRWHPLGPCLYLWCWLQVPYRVGEYFEAGRRWPLWARVNSRLHVITWAVIVAMLVAWAVRMVIS